MLKRLSTLWHFPDVDDAVRGPSMIVAQIVVFVAPICLGAAIGHLAAGRIINAALVTVTAIAMTTGLVLLRRGKNQLGRIVFYFPTSLLAAIQVLLFPPGSGIEMAFPLIIAAGYMIFPRSELRWRHAAVIFSVLMTAAAAPLQFADLPRPTMTALEMTFVRISSFTCVIFAFLAMIAYYVNRGEDAASELKRANGLFELVNRSIDECFFIVSADGRQVVYVSPRFAPMFGVEAGEIQKDWARLIALAHPDDAARLLATYADPGVRTRSVVDFRAGRAEDGSWKHFRQVLRIIEPPAVPAPVWVGVVSDVTEQTRTAESAEAHRLKLIHAARLSLLGEMAGGVAHEINNPLTVIRGSVEIIRNHIRDGHPTDTVLQPAERIDAMVRRIAAIVRGLRSFAGENGDGMSALCSVRRIVDEALDLCAERIRNHGVQLDVVFGEGNPKVLGSPVQISQVMINLLSNALHAVQQLPERWIRIEVAVAAERRVEIRVVDSGSGLPPEVASQLMRPFFTTKPVGTGTGLGLSISRGIAQSHGGDLELDGEAKHTTFVLTLPVADGAAKVA